MSPAFTSSWRLGVVCLAVLVSFGAVGTRLYLLHVVEAGNLLEIVERNRRQIVVQSARRGNIVDTNGNLLATTRTEVELGVDPQALREEDREKWPQLAAMVGKSVPELEAIMSRRTTRGSSGFADDVRLVRWQKLHDSLSEAEFQAVMDLGVRGVYGNRRFSRFYPGQELAAHMIGYLNREETAVTGVERAMDFYLRGQNGWVESERDGRRQELVQFRSREVLPTDGLHVQLSIDNVIQHMVERELEQIVREHNPKGATIIVSEPATGYILGLGNYPTFDLNQFNTSPLENQRNLAVTDLLEPGSTFKIVPVAAALDQGLVSPDTVFDCGITAIQVGNRSVRLPRDHRPFGDMTVAEIVTKSSNIGVAHLGVLMGATRLHDYSARFGFGERTEFGLGGEVRGTLHDVRDWDGLTITRLPMGHAVSATPMQIHAAMGAIANRGILMRPQVIRQALNREGRTVVSFPPHARRRVVSEEAARTLAAMLVQVTGPEGTAIRAAIPGYEVAGKTGTTQKIVNGRYSNRHHVASFSGFFPAAQPRVVLTVIVDEPRGGGNSYGGLVAAPSFQRIGEQLIPYLGIPPTNEQPSYFAVERNLHDPARSGL